MNRPARMSRGAEPLEGPSLQVAPMLDMAFQLLAFFILTFQPPSQESRMDLYLPAAPAALPGGTVAQANSAPPANLPDPPDLDATLTITAAAADDGDLLGLMLGDTPVTGVRDLADRLKRYRKVIENQPFKIVLRAEDALKYQHVIQILQACLQAQADNVSLAAPANNAPPPAPAPAPEAGGTAPIRSSP